MLSVRKKSKKKKGSLGFIRNLSESVSDVDNRVVMLCEDIPSEGSSWDSGRGSNSSGARSSSEELGHGWRSRSFHGRGGQSMSSPPTPIKQYSVREIRHAVSSPVYRYNGDHSTLTMRDLYVSAYTLFCLHVRICRFGNVFKTADLKFCNGDCVHDR